MEAKTKVALQSLDPFRHLFPKVQDVDHTVKMGASVADTVKFIPMIVKRDSWHVRNYVDQELRNLPQQAALEKLWNFVKYHIEYVPDKRGDEQVRSGRRLIHDGKGDCDCFTTFIDKCLFELNIPFINRITKYKEDRFQHIYPIVPTGNGKYIVMDAVVGNFNYEEPYSEKEDYPMELHYLDGIDDTSDSLIGIDAQDLFGNDEDFGDFGKIKKRGGGGGGAAPAKKGIFKRSPEKKAKAKEKRKAIGKKALKVVNKVNKFNPATALLRAGILASMKLNVMKVAEKIKWGYATKEFAASKGMDMSKYDKLKAVLQKAEKIFFAAGGKPENLKKSILTGHGNRNREVQGIDGFGNYTSMPELLGAIYYDEFVDGMEGLGELGEPATAASITAAAGAMGGLAALLASIGALFPKKNKDKKEKKGLFKKRNSGGGGDGAAEAEGGGEENAAPAEEGNADALPEEATNPPSDPSEGPDEQPSDDSEPASEETENLPAPTDENTEVSAGEGGGEPAPESPEEGTDGILSGTGIGIKAFYQKNKKWIIPVGIGAAVIGTILLINHFSKDETKAAKPRSLALNGLGRTKHKRKKGGNAGGQHEKKSLIALM